MFKDGIIVRQISGFYDVMIDREVCMCAARGIFRKKNVSPMVGDKVKVDTNERVIVSIIPRKNQIRRPAVSNIDYLGIVIAPKNPIPDFLLMDKLIISTQINDIIPSIIINKVDLVSQQEVDIFESEYSGAGYRIFRTSCSDMFGIDVLKNSFSSGIVALAGQSGVGKSSLLNLICPNAKLDVGQLSNKTTTGKHTTTHAQLLPLPNGSMLIDTPGFSSVDIEDILPSKLQYFYNEFTSLIGLCRFDDCLHDSEPDCIVKEKVNDKTIASGRYERYITFLRILKEKRGRFVL